MIPYRLLLLLHDDEPAKHAPMRFTPGGCCPCGVPDQCNICEDDTSADEYDIVLAGIVCSCGTLNGTYRVTRESNCVWAYHFSPFICEVYRLELRLIGNVGLESIAVALYRAGSPALSWDEPFTPLLNCNFSNRSIPFSADFLPNCDGASSTCHVTAV